MSESRKSYSVAEASELLGITKQSLRLWLQSGHCPVGDAFMGSGGEYIYYISAPKLDSYISHKEGEYQ